MIHLPNAVDANVEELKLRDYLLNSDHPQNGGKSAFFHAFGFEAGQWPALRRALIDHAVVNPVAETSRSPHGAKYLVRCSVQTPDGRNPCIVTVWIVEGDFAPRLVTSYPWQGES